MDHYQVTVSCGNDSASAQLPDQGAANQYILTWMRMFVSGIKYPTQECVIVHPIDVQIIFIKGATRESQYN